MSPADNAALVHRLAGQVGFDLVGIAEARRVDRAKYLRDWLARGRAGRMAYLDRYFEQRVDPRRLLDGARSVIVVALNYRQVIGPPPDDQPRGRVAMYAWGDDYHVVVKDRLRKLIDALRSEIDDPFDARPYVDTAPILEREWAAAAGVGWIGKNTLAINRELGSYFVLGEIVTTLDLACDPPAADRCGTCTCCLDACPTGALSAPYQMDASRCISYLTIELREDVPAEFHRQMGDWVFGCDICQQVCPHNRKAPAGSALGIRSPGPHPVLSEILSWTPDAHRAAVQGSAMDRATLAMFKRNARIAMANIEETSTVDRQADGDAGPPAGRV